MKYRSARWSGVLSAAIFLGAWGGAQALAVTLTVDDDGVECPSAGFTTIQSAVDAAAPGSTVEVCPGVYNEQVTIPKRLRLQSQTGNDTVIAPSPMVANSTSLFDGDPIAAAILVTAPTGSVVIRRLIVDTEGNGIAGCSPELIGIFYRNASGKVLDTAIRNLEVDDPFCSSGVGVLAQSGEGGAAEVLVEGSSIHDYQRAGIVGNEVGTLLKATDNVVQGNGPTTGVTQHGVQVGFGARGVLRRNASFDHVSETCTTLPCDTATGFLVLEANNTLLRNNTSAGNQTGIFVSMGQNNDVTENQVFGTTHFDGIILVGNSNTATSNNITGTERAGVSIVGDLNVVRNNRINEAEIGVWEQSGTGNTTTPNLIINTLTPYQTGTNKLARAAASSEADSVSAYR